MNLPWAGGFIGLQTCIDELIAAKCAANRRPRYVDSLEHYLRQFAVGQEQRNLCEFTFLELENWLAKYDNASTKITWVSRFSALFSFAVRRGYIAANPCDRLEKISVDRKPPFILTPARSREIIAATPTVLIPYLVLGMFAGIRPEEILRMQWTDIDLETKTVRVDGKTRQRRIVPLPEIAVRYLAKHPLRTGSVAPSASTVTRWKHRIRALLGLPRWPQDLLRHTAASYLIALHSDAGKVATMLGNSSKILLTHYHEPVTAADCAAFWDI